LHPFQAHPADGARRDDRGGGHPSGADLSGARDLAAVRPCLLDAADRAGHSGNLPGTADVNRACRPAMLQKLQKAGMTIIATSHMMRFIGMPIFRKSRNLYPPAA